jgi:hypothetical protein
MGVDVTADLGTPAPEDTSGGLRRRVGRLADRRPSRSEAGGLLGLALILLTMALVLVDSIEKHPRQSARAGDHQGDVLPRSQRDLPDRRSLPR